MKTSDPLYKLVINTLVIPRLFSIIHFVIVQYPIHPHLHHLIRFTHRYHYFTILRYHFLLHFIPSHHLPHPDLLTSQVMILPF